MTGTFGASVALTNTKVKYAIIKIDGDCEENQNPQTNFDEGEFTETVFLPFDNLPDALQGIQSFI